MIGVAAIVSAATAFAGVCLTGAVFIYKDLETVELKKKANEIAEKEAESHIKRDKLRTLRPHLEIISIEKTRKKDPAKKGNYFYRVFIEAELENDSDWPIAPITEELAFYTAKKNFDIGSGSEVEVIEWNKGFDAAAFNSNFEHDPDDWFGDGYDSFDETDHNVLMSLGPHEIHAFRKHWYISAPPKGWIKVSINWTVDIDPEGADYSLKYPGRSTWAQAKK